MRSIDQIGVFALLVALSVPALGQPKKAAPAPAGSTVDKPAVEAYLRRLELWPSQVQVRVDDPKPFIAGLDKINIHLSAGAASKDIVYYISSDRKTILRGDPFRLDRDPFQPELDQLKFQHQPEFGAGDTAPITLVVFSDFQCPLCREEAKELREKITAEFAKDVRAVFIDFPLESIHPWSKFGAIGGRCAYRQGGALFWDYHDWIFEHQADINADNFKSKAADWAKGKKLDAAQFSQCIETRATESEVNAEIALGHKLQIDSTPTNFLNGRRLAGRVPWPNLSQIIKLELELKRHK